MTGLKIKEIAELLGGDEATVYRRTRTLGRVATAKKFRVDAPFNPSSAAFGHKTAAKLFDRYAVAWACLLFYFTEILNIEEETAQVEAMPSFDSLRAALDGIAKREKWTLVIESQAYWNDGYSLLSQIFKDEDEFKGSTNPDAILTKITVPLANIIKPALSLAA